MPNFLARPTPERIQKILDATDWKGYNQKVNFHLQKPNCPPYDGGALCGHWQGWIWHGRVMYPQGEDGERIYTKELRQLEPRLRLSDIQNVLEELNNCSIAQALVHRYL
jgi:hypothetical protein